MTKINLEAARAAYVGAATKDAATLDVYAGQISEALGKSWAQIAKKKAKDCSEQEKIIRDATQEERAAFYAAIETSYKGKGKWQDVARVYWNRVVAHALPPKPKGAGVTEAREISERFREEIGKLIKAYYREEGSEANIDEANEYLELAFVKAGGDIVKLKEAMA
jgi:hypothetical protein